MRYNASEPNCSTLVFTSCPFFESGLDPSALAPGAWLTLTRPNVVSTVYSEVEPMSVVGRLVSQLAVEENPTYRSSHSLSYGTTAIGIGIRTRMLRAIANIVNILTAGRCLLYTSDAADE